MEELRENTKTIILDDELINAVNLYNTIKSLNPNISLTKYEDKLIAEVNELINDYFYKKYNVDKNQVKLLDSITNLSEINNLLHYDNLLNNLVTITKDYQDNLKLNVKKIKRKLSYLKLKKNKLILLDSDKKITNLINQINKSKIEKDDFIVNIHSGCPLGIFHYQTKTSLRKVKLADFEIFDQSNSYYIAKEEYVRLQKKLQKERFIYAKDLITDYQFKYIKFTFLTFIIYVVATLAIFYFASINFYDITNFVYITAGASFVLYYILAIIFANFKKYSYITKTRVNIIKSFDNYMAQTISLDNDIERFLTVKFTTTMRMTQLLLQIIFSLIIAVLGYFILENHLGKEIYYLSFAYFSGLMFMEIAMNNRNEGVFGIKSSSSGIYITKIPLYLGILAFLLLSDDVLINLGIMFGFPMLISGILPNLFRVNRRFGGA